MTNLFSPLSYSSSSLLLPIFFPADRKRNIGYVVASRTGNSFTATNPASALSPTPFLSRVNDGRSTTTLSPVRRPPTLVFAGGSDQPDICFDVKIFSGSGHPTLSNEIAQELGLPLGKICTGSGLGEVQLLEPVAGYDVILVQPIYAPFEDHVEELISMIYACKIAGSSSITLVIPYTGYSVLKRKHQRNSVVDAGIVESMLASVGADQVISCDIPTECRKPIETDAWVLLINYIAPKTSGFQDVVVVSTNLDLFESAHSFANVCNAKSAFIDKMKVVGDIKGKIAIIYDDFIDTAGAGTLSEAATLLRQNGVSRVYLCAIHSVFSRSAVAELSSALFDEIIVTNTTPISEECNFPKLTVLSIANVMATMIISSRLYKERMSE